MINDADVVKAAEGFVRIIIRRPHAYKFANDHAGASIPGVAFLDAEGKLTGNYDLKSSPKAKGLLEEMTKQLK